MKKVVFIFLIFAFNFCDLIGQVSNTYGPKKENYYSTWIKEGNSTPRFWIPDHYCGYWSPNEVRNINYWSWTYNDIPTEATVTEVTIKFRAVKSTP